MNDDARENADGEDLIPAVRRVADDQDEGSSSGSGEPTPAFRRVSADGETTDDETSDEEMTRDGETSDESVTRDDETSDERVTRDDETSDDDELIPAVRRISDHARWPDEGSVEATAGSVAEAASDGEDRGASEPIPEDVREYRRFSKIDGATYERANEFLRDRTYITAREWAMARLCADFRTETGVEMTKIGENLPELVPFMTDTYTPQAVNQARSSFDDKVRKAGATFLYGAMCDFYTAEELDDLMYEITEVAKFLLEVEGVELGVDEELSAEERISSVMREVRESSAALRHDELCCPNCGHEMRAGADPDSTGVAADEPADD